MSIKINIKQLKRPWADCITCRDIYYKAQRQRKTGKQIKKAEFHMEFIREKHKIMVLHFCKEHLKDFEEEVKKALMGFIDLVEVMPEDDNDEFQKEIEKVFTVKNP
ncbi:MAG: hypothetical protein WC302_00920 [Candidatus Paceibacterota bacterium]|jgi:hypothetical protein